MYFDKDMNFLWNFLWTEKFQNIHQTIGNLIYHWQIIQSYLFSVQICAFQHVFLANSMKIGKIHLISKKYLFCRLFHWNNIQICFHWFLQRQRGLKLTNGSVLLRMKNSEKPAKKAFMPVVMPLQVLQPLYPLWVQERLPQSQ